MSEPSSGTAMRGYQHGVLAVAELTPQARDADILAWAAHDQKVLITNDKGFGGW